MTSLRVSALLLLCLVALSSSADEKQERAKLQALQAEIKALQLSLEKRARVRNALGRELEARELALASISEKIAGLDRDANTLERELRDLANQQQQLEQSRQAQQQHIAREVNAAFRLGRAEPLKLLLNQEDPDQFNRALGYYRYFARARSKKISEYRATQEKLSGVAAAIEAKQQAISDNRSALDAEKVALTDQQQKRHQVLEQIDRELGSEKARLARMLEERQHLEAILARLEDAIQNLASPDTDPFPKLRGRLPWPIQGKVLQAYGSLRAPNLPWKGWLIAASEGTPVQAVHSGRIVFSDYLRGHGLVLIIDHGNHYLSLYAHNQVLLKETGDWVSSGENIAFAGRTGGLADSALYFEIRHNGQPLDPKSWLGARR